MSQALAAADVFSWDEPTWAEMFEHVFGVPVEMLWPYQRRLINHLGFAEEAHPHYTLDAERREIWVHEPDIAQLARRAVETQDLTAWHRRKPDIHAEEQ